MTFKKGTAKVLKILAWTIASILILVLLLIVAIQLPSVQNFGRKKIVSFLENKIGTDVAIKRLSVDFPKKIVLEGVFFADQSKDTLLYGNELKVNLDFAALLNNKVDISSIDLNGINLKLVRDSLGRFNYDYIIDAFSPEKQSTDSSAPLNLKLDYITLDDIRLKYIDDMNGFALAGRLGHFDTRVETFDLENQVYSIPNITLNNVVANVRQYRPLAQKLQDNNDTPVADTLPLLPDFNFKKLDLKNISVTYTNSIEAVHSQLDLGMLLVNNDELKLPQRWASLDEIKLHNTTAVVRLGKKPAAKKVVEEVKESADSTLEQAKREGWRVMLARLDLADNRFLFYDSNTAVVRNSFDVNHLSVKGLYLNASNLQYNPDSISGNVNRLRFSDTSGFVLNEFTTRFLYASTAAELQNLYISTPHTTLRRSIRITYPSVAELATNPSSIRYIADFDNAKIGAYDILKFAPQLRANPLFAQNPNGTIYLDGSLRGSINELQLGNVSLNAFNKIKLSASGSIQNLSDPNNISANLNIASLTTTGAALKSILPPAAIPPTITLPEQIALRGTVSGSAGNLKMNAHLNTSMGSAYINGTLANLTDPNSIRYNTTLRFSNFEVGKLAQQQALGRATGEITLNGTGTDVSYLNADVKGNIQSFVYNGYDYNNISFDGRINKGNFVVKGVISDDHLAADFDADVALNQTYPAIDATIMIDSANLQALGFTTQPIRVHGKVDANIPALNLDALNANVSVSDFVLNNGGRRVFLDSLNLLAQYAEGVNSLTVNSSVGYVWLKGKFSYDRIGDAFVNAINKYYFIAPVSRPLPNQEFEFAARIYSSATLRDLAPQLLLTDSVFVNGSLNGTQLNLEARAPGLSYANMKLDGMTLKANSNDTALVYSLITNNLQSAGLRVPYAGITGDMANNRIGFKVNLKDLANKDRYNFSGDVVLRNDVNYLSLDPGTLLLNYESWNLQDNNSIAFGAAGVSVENFILSQNGQQLKIYSNPPGLNNPLHVDFTNFDIATISEIAQQDSTLLGGLINGNLVVKNFDTNPEATADLTIENFTFKGDTIGNLVAKVEKNSSNLLGFDVALTGRGNQVDIDGNYAISTQDINATISINPINLASIEKFTAGFLKQMSGFATGNLTATGKLTEPKIRGDLEFTNATVNVAMFNSLFRLQNERISFNDEGIRFYSFTLRDSLNNTAVLNGIAYTTDYFNYEFDLHFDAENFQILNSTKKDNPIYYGSMFVTTEAEIRGTQLRPHIDGSIQVEDGTLFTFVLPQPNNEALAREGVIEFFDQDKISSDSILAYNYDTVNVSSYRGMEILGNITVVKEAIVNIVLDEAAGDFVNLRGEANLTGGIDPSGKISLTGTYVLEEGAYSMSYSLLSRRFEIEKGSSLTWTGAPTDAQLNVTAVYVANAAPIDLVERQLGNVTPAVRASYKQRLPFNVRLRMTGELLKPDINLDIVLPEKNYNVAADIITATNTRLDQLRREPSEMNKQVLSLMVFNRFVEENPFESSTSTSFETMARQSVSKLLVEQLNSFAGGMIGGMDVNFGLNSYDDYTTGTQATRTDFNVGLSKRLMNDRLTVSIGSNFQLEGPQHQNEQVNNIAGDIELLYKLTKDGRLMAKLYRKNQYHVSLQGQVIETAAGLLVAFDYDKFRELLANKKKALRQDIQQNDSTGSSQ